MGGDGGVIASNRRYMRGAGTADHTGDAATTTSAHVDAAVEREEQARTMRFCAVSNNPLVFDDATKMTIVVCPYGRLYAKEALLEALLRRKETPDHRLNHIRGLKDVHAVRFQVHKDSEGKKVPSCPVRGTELNGKIPAVVLIPGRPDGTNALSERAVQELGEEAIANEYGPAEKKIKLAPTREQLAEIQEQLESAQKKKKNSKKRKREATNTKKLETRGEGESASTELPSKITQNENLRGLFTSSSKSLSEKERTDNLFTRNG